MSETKPQKRLVSKEEYVRVMGRKGRCHLEAVVAVALLLPMGCITVVWIFFYFVQPLPEVPQLWGVPLVMLFVGGMLKLCSYSRYMFTKAKAVEQVVSITEKNAHLLPAQETLLRGSDLPPTVQQTELLRATQAGQETPQEQLLRATNGDE